MFTANYKWDFLEKAYFPEEKTLNIVQKENQRRLEAGRI